MCVFVCVWVNLCVSVGGMQRCFGLTVDTAASGTLWPEAKRERANANAISTASIHVSVGYDFSPGSSSS